jgi:hypothetical protein
MEADEGSGEAEVPAGSSRRVPHAAGGQRAGGGAGGAAGGGGEDEWEDEDAQLSGGSPQRSGDY